MPQFIPMKQWRYTEAAKHGVSLSCISHWLYDKNKYPRLIVKRKNKRVVFVKV